MTKNVYSGRRFRGIQNRFKHEGQFPSPRPQEEMQYTLSYFRDHGGDMIGIYMEKSWGQRRGAHSKDYGAHVWNVTLLCE